MRPLGLKEIRGIPLPFRVGVRLPARVAFCVQIGVVVVRYLVGSLGKGKRNLKSDGRSKIDRYSPYDKRIKESFVGIDIAIGSTVKRNVVGRHEVGIGTRWVEIPS